MTEFFDTLIWIAGITLLPSLICLVKTETAYQKTEKESDTRRKLRIPRILLWLFAAFQIVFSGAFIAEYDFSSYLSVVLLLTIFLGIPLTTLTMLIPAVVCYLRCPKDAPERIVLKRKLITAGVVCGILIVVFVAFIIWFAIGIAHM